MVPKNLKTNLHKWLTGSLLWSWSLSDTKGQIKPKADWNASHRFSQKANEQILVFCHNSPEILETWNFDFKLQVFADGKAKKNVHSVFGRIYGTPICLRFYLTFISTRSALASCWVNRNCLHVKMFCMKPCKCDYFLTGNTQSG